jgi:DHA1 family bicyclomycin/chloramphenicol resistance-like MFS transporter
MARLSHTSPYFTLFLTTLVAAGAMSTDIYLPSLPDMTRAFATTVSRVQLTLSVFFVGFAVAQLICGPLADRFGRRPVLMVGIALYVVASGLCLIAPSIEMLIAGRFLQALGACAGPVVARAIVRDTFPPDQAARVFATMASVFALTPAVAPMVGGHLHAAFGWRANFVVMMLFGLLQLLGSWRLLDETLRRPDRHALHPGRMLANYLRLLKDRMFLGHTLTLTFFFAAMFSFISGSPFILIDILGVTPDHFGYATAFVVFGFLCGSISAARLTQRLGSLRLVRVGLGLGVLAASVLAALAWAHVESVIAIILPTSVVFMTCGLAMPNCTALAITPYARIAGSASALLGFIQMALASGIGWLVGRFYNGTTIPMTSLVLASLVAAALSHLLLVSRRAS